MDLNDNVFRLWEKYGPIVLGMGRKILIAVLVVIGGKIVISLSRRLTEKAVTGKLRADETIASLLRVAIQYGVIIICGIMILDNFGFNTAGLIALLGAAGVAIGFALKDTLSNIAAGIILIFLRPFSKGDFIECGSISGAVREIGLFTTIMETGDGIFISAPNSNFWGIPLKNFSRNSKRRMDITVTISYSDSIDAAFQVLQNIIHEEHRFMKEPHPQVLVQSLGETGMGITLRAWVQSGVYWRVFWDQMKNVKEKIQEAGLNIAVPRREIQLVQGETRKEVSSPSDNPQSGQ
jgi:small conductance mechanosensitive channel